MYKIDILGCTTPHNMIRLKYQRAKDICLCIWDRPRQVQTFEDIFHDTIYLCLRTLGQKNFSQDYLKGYFFKAFRINMIRHFGYSYNKWRSGVDVETAIIPITEDYSSHIDGFGMLDLVEATHGKDVRNMLWMNLNGYTYAELDKIYDTNSYYTLSKVKNGLKAFYNVSHGGQSPKISIQL